MQTRPADTHDSPAAADESDATHVVRLTESEGWLITHGLVVLVRDEALFERGAGRAGRARHQERVPELRRLIGKINAALGLVR